MNFLDKKAMKKAAKHIEPYLDRGEALMDFDIGRVPAGQVALLATNMALYICPLPLRRQPMISPYVAMADAERHGRSLYLQSYGGAQLVVDLGTGTRGLSLSSSSTAAPRAPTGGPATATTSESRMGSSRRPA